MDHPHRTHGVTVNYRAEEERVPPDHPLRKLKGIVAATLDELGPELQGLFAGGDPPTIAPEKILRLHLLQALYSVRNEGLMLEQLGYNLLFRWFVGMAMDDHLWEPAVYARNRDALLGSGPARRFSALVRERAEGAGLLSDEHFTVDLSLFDS